MRRAAAILLVFLGLTAWAVAQTPPPADSASDDDTDWDDAVAEAPAAPVAAEGGAPLPPAAPLGIEDEDLMGRPVSRVQLDIPPTMIDRKIRRVIKFKEGRPFSRADCRRTVQRLFLRGDVADVTIKADPAADGSVAVKVTVRPIFGYRDLFLTGHRRYNEGEIRRFMRFEPGGEYREADLDLFRERIAVAYRAIGYAAAEVKISAKLDKAESRADLTVKIREGKSFKMRDLILTGDPGVDPDLVRRKLRWYYGWTFKEDSVTGGAVALEKHLRSHHPLWESRAWASQNYLEAEVGEPTFTFDARARAVDVQLTVRAGKRVRVEFDPKVFSYWERRRTLDKALAIREQRIVNRWVVRDMTGTVKAYLQRRGRYQAQVTVDYQETDAEKVVRFSALPGEKWSIAAVEFAGASSFPAARLTKELGDPGTYEAVAFETALTHVVRFYNTQGFLSAEVKGVRVTETDAKARRLAVRVEIAEGPQTILGSVRFAGNTFLDDDGLRASLPFKVGRPLDPFQIAPVENSTQERYVTQGYIRARVNHDLVFNDSQTRADLVFHVEEGERYYVGDIFIRGNRLTKRHVIERELLFREGVPYNCNLVFRSEQALARLGFFKSAKIEPVTAGFEEKTIDLIVYVVERNSGHGAVGLGYNTVDGVQGSVEIGHRNLAGHGRQIDFTAQGFVRDARFRLDKHRMALSFLWPWIARIPLDGNVTASDQLREEAAFDATEFRLTLGVSTYFDRLWNYLPATKRLGGLLTLSQFFQGSLSWSREQSFVFNVDPLAGRDAGIRSGEVLLAYLSPSIVRNSRNDAFNPSGGSYNTIAAEWAAPFLGSTAYYVKVTGKSSWYFPLDRLLRFLPGSTFAFNVSAGWAMPIAPTTEVPVTKRFFLGGYTSLRGYDPAQVGPRGGERNEAVGGNFSAVANADFRLRIWNGIGMLLFADAGNVYPDAAAIDPADVRYSVGLGLRYITPVGPIAADYGFALDRREGADFGQFYFSIGNAF